MSQHLVALKVALVNIALASAPAVVMVQVSETAAEAQMEGQALYHVAAIMGIASSTMAIGWYAFLAACRFAAWWRERGGRK
jgi:hypothetical protein